MKKVFLRVTMIVVAAVFFMGLGCDNGTKTKTKTVYVDKKEIQLWWSSGSPSQPNNPKALCGMDYCVGADMWGSVVFTNGTDKDVKFSISHDLHQGSAVMASSGNVVDKDNNIVLPADAGGGAPGGGGGGGGAAPNQFSIKPGQAFVINFHEYTSDITAGETAWLDFVIQLEDGTEKKLSKEIMFGSRPLDSVTESVRLNDNLWLNIGAWNAPYNMNDETYNYTFCSGGDCEQRETIAEQQMFWHGTYVREPDDDGARSVDHYFKLNDSSDDVAWGYDYYFYEGVSYDNSSYDGVASSFLGNTLYMMGTEYTILDAGVFVYMKDEVPTYQLDSLTMIDTNYNTVELRNGMEIWANGEYLSGTEVHFSQYSSQLFGFTMYWTPDDKIYLDTTDYLEGPLSSSIMVNFKMPDAAEYDAISAETIGSSRGVFRFQDATGRNVEIPVNYSSFDGVRLGEDREIGTCEGRMLLDGELCNAADYGSLSGFSFPFSTWWGGLYIMEVADINDLGNGFMVLEIQDKTNVSTLIRIVEKDVSTKLDYCPEYDMCVGFGILITSNYRVQVYNNLADPIITNNMAEIILNSDGSIKVSEDYWMYDQAGNEWTKTWASLSFQYNAVDNELQVTQPTTYPGLPWYRLDKYSDWLTSTSNYGSEMMWNRSTKDYAEVLYPPYIPEMEVGVAIGN